MFGPGSSANIIGKNGNNIPILIKQTNLEEQFYAETMFVKYIADILFEGDGFDDLYSNIDETMMRAGSGSICKIQIFGEEHECRILNIDINRPTVALFDLRSESILLPQCSATAEITFITTVQSHIDMENDWAAGKTNPKIEKRKNDKVKEISRFDLMEFDE